LPRDAPDEIKLTATRRSSEAFSKRMTKQRGLNDQAHPRNNPEMLPSHWSAQQCVQITNRRSDLLSQNTKAGLMAMCHPGVPAVIGQTRIYCHQGKEFLLVEVPSKDAPIQIKELTDQGWEIEAEIPV